MGNKLKVKGTMTIRGKEYEIANEVCPKGCQGCYFYDMNCTKDMTDVCRQGFIFKRIKQ